MHVLTPAHVQASPHSTLLKVPAVNTLQPDLRAPASASTFRAGEIGTCLPRLHFFPPFFTPLAVPLVARIRPVARFSGAAADLGGRPGWRPSSS